MRKSEMSDKQLADRQMIVSALEKAGWDATSENELFDKGLWKEYEVQYEREHHGLTFSVSHSAKSGEWLWSMGRGGKGIRLVMQCKSRLADVLQWILDVQDKIDEDNYKDSVKHLVKICPKTYADRGEEEGLVQLTAGDEKKRKTTTKKK
jgi:hypothetical protein